MRTMTAMLVILLSLGAPVLAEDTKSPSKDRDIVENREPLFGEAMGLLAVLSLWEGRYLDACVHFTLAIVHGRSKYRDRLSGVKIVMFPGEIEARSRNAVIGLGSIFYIGICRLSYLKTKTSEAA